MWRPKLCNLAFLSSNDMRLAIDPSLFGELGLEDGFSPVAHPVRLSGLFRLRGAECLSPVRLRGQQSGAGPLHAGELPRGRRVVRSVLLTIRVRKVSQCLNDR